MKKKKDSQLIHRDQSFIQKIVWSIETKVLYKKS